MYVIYEILCNFYENYEIYAIGIKIVKKQTESIKITVSHILL